MFYVLISLGQKSSYITSFTLGYERLLVAMLTGYVVFRWLYLTNPLNLESQTGGDLSGSVQITTPDFGERIRE